MKWVKIPRLPMSKILGTRATHHTAECIEICKGTEGVQAHGSFDTIKTTR